MAAQGFINRPMSIALDGVRGVAAVVVLAGHAVQQDIYTGPWWFDDSLQHNAVVVFFVLSGLVIANSAFRRRATLADYAIARAARVGPMALFAVGLGLVAWLLGQNGQLDVIAQDPRYTQFSLRAVLLPLLFLSETPYGAGPLWNPPYWSLFYEVWFYALFGAAVYLRGWRRLVVLPALALIPGLGVLMLLPVWLMGVALARFAPAKAVNPQAGCALIAGGLALQAFATVFQPVFLVMLMDAFHVEAAAFGFAQFVVSDIIFGIGMVLCFVGMKPLVERGAAVLERVRPQVSWLAECSFTLYLIHWPILTLLRGYGVVAGDNPLLFVALLALIVALAGQIAKVTEHRRPQVRQWLADRWAGGPGEQAAPPAPTDRLRRALSRIAIPVLAMFAFAGWLVAPAPLEPTVSPRTVTTLARAPFAERIVIGDSRAYGAPSRGGVLFAAYPGATIEDMARLAGALCLLSNAQIVIALGANDAKADMRRPAASLSALRQMIDGCGRERVWVSEVWPGEPAKLPAGPDFDAATIAALNHGIRQLAASGVGHLIAQPALTGHTRDGIHFDEPTAARYEAMLAGFSAT